MCSTIKIRGHHLLCMLGFRGLGYSNSFVSNMRRVVDLVLEKPETMIEVVASCDSICEACPHKEGESCSNSSCATSGVKSSDMAVLSHIGLTPGTCIASGEAYRLIATSVDVKDIGAKFCLQCSWRELGYCNKGLDALKMRMK